MGIRELATVEFFGDSSRNARLAHCRAAIRALTGLSGTRRSSPPDGVKRLQPAFGARLAPVRESGCSASGASPNSYHGVPMRVYAFEGPSIVYACESLTYAEDYFEAIDVENDEYVFFGADGTVIGPSIRDGRVVLTPRNEKRPEELRTRLRTYLEYLDLAMSPSLADDPATLADLLIEQERARSWPRWPAWLRTRRSR